MSTCALLTSIPTHVPSVLTREPPARRVSRILTQPCECGLSVLAGPSNGSGSAGQRWDDLAGERSCQTWGSAIRPTLLRASGSFAGRGFKIQGLLALDLAVRALCLGGILRACGAPLVRGRTPQALQVMMKQPARG